MKALLVLQLLKDVKIIILLDGSMQNNNKSGLMYNLATTFNSILDDIKE